MKSVQVTGGSKFGARWRSPWPSPRYGARRRLRLRPRRAGAAAGDAARGKARYTKQEVEVRASRRPSSTKPQGPRPRRRSRPGRRMTVDEFVGQRQAKIQKLNQATDRADASGCCGSPRTTIPRSRTSTSASPSSTPRSSATTASRRASLDQKIFERQAAGAEVALQARAEELRERAAAVAARRRSRRTSRRPSSASTSAWTRCCSASPTCCRPSARRKTRRASSSSA